MALISYTPIPEAVWRAAERDQVRRERLRLFRNGTIRPRTGDLPPTTLYKVGESSDNAATPGLWRRALGFFHPLRAQ
jgi:hypothetical protein